MGEWISVARYNELARLWEAEDYCNPETFLYRNDLTSTERKLIDRWDRQFVKGQS